MCAVSYNIVQAEVIKINGKDIKLRIYAKNVGKTSFTASKVKSFGALSFSTMIVITIANTPSHDRFSIR